MEDQNPIDETKTRLTDSKGRVFQVLLPDGSDWDEEATNAACMAAQEDEE